MQSIGIEPFIFYKPSQKVTDDIVPTITLTVS